MEKFYEPINFVDNSPPYVNAENLNKMDSAIDELDRRVAEQTPVNNLLATVAGKPLDATMGKVLGDKVNALGGFTPIIDETTGKITGYKTEIGGADTVFPFSGSAEPFIYNSSAIYLATEGGAVTTITTLDTSDFSIMNLYVTAISTKNSSKSNIQLYDASGNFITETGNVANQGQSVIEEFDISSYDKIVVKIVGTATASGTSSKAIVTVVLY